MRRHSEGFSAAAYACMTLALMAVAMLCVCVGSVSVPLGDTLTALWCAMRGEAVPAGISATIILSVRLPRVICVALVGASLSLCGAAMQGLLRNSLADGSTLGVSSGASLGAVTALAFDISIPALPWAGTTAMAMLFAFASLVLILSLAYALDRSLATHSIILIGVIFSMFVSSLINLAITFAGEKIKTITFWTMGSLAGSDLENALLLGAALFLCGVPMLCCARELNAFSTGENNARHIGVPVRRVKLTVLLAASALIGVCVSVGGSIGFVGLVTPHMARLLVGSNHQRLLPVSLYFGAIFLLLADLIARTLLRPAELPIGVVTSLVGAVVFVVLFSRGRKGR